MYFYSFIENLKCSLTVSSLAGLQNNVTIFQVYVQTASLNYFNFVSEKSDFFSVSLVDTTIPMSLSCRRYREGVSQRRETERIQRDLLLISPKTDPESESEFVVKSVFSTR